MAYSRVKSKAPKDAKVWILSDIHLGVKNNDRRWLDRMTDFFYEWFLPLVDRHADGDILMVTGDIFEVRKSIHQLVLNRAVKIFQEFAKRFEEVHVVVGNHDIFLKNSTEVTALEVFGWMNNVEVYKEPTYLDLNGKELFLMPWVGDDTQESKILRSEQGDYAFCHINVQGARISNNWWYEEGVPLDSFGNFKRVYTGHIHYRQRFEGVNIVGNPYQVIRHDAGNTKGIYVLDPETGEETFYENDYSPRYVKMDLGKEEDLDAKIADVKEKVRGNFLDLHVPSEVQTAYKVNLLRLELDEVCLQMEVIPYNQAQRDLLAKDSGGSDFKNFDILSLCEKASDELDAEKEEKKKVKKKVREIYERAKEQDE